MGGRADSMTKLIVAFRNFANEPKIHSITLPTTALI